MTKKNRSSARKVSIRTTDSLTQQTLPHEDHEHHPADSEGANSRPTVPPPPSGIVAPRPIPDDAPQSALSGRGLSRPLSTPPKPPTHEYEPLEGGSGREVYYRQARFAISDLLGEHVDVQHVVRFGAAEGTIVDFGINGVAFSMGISTCEPDDTIDKFCVRIGDCTLYEGRASVRYCRRESNGSTIIGAVLLDGILDTDAVITAKNRALANKTAQLLTVALGAEVAPAYRQALADMVLLLSSYRRSLSEQEESLASLSTASAKSSAEQDVLMISIERFRKQYEPYRKLCNSLTRELSGTAKRAYRQYTEALLHPYVLSAPLAHRCYDKPLGYPGDFVLMSYLYDKRPYGKTLYDRLIHEVVCRDEPMGNAVVKRKDFLLEQIWNVVRTARCSPQQPCRIMSLASGPAQEVLEFARECRDDSKTVLFTLIDQDQRSLTYVNSNLSRALIPGSTKIRAKYLYLGFKHMISNSEAFDELPAQDLIYVAGLFDYVKTATAQRLVHRLFRKLAPGGRLLVGNFKAPNNALWSMEYWMDWHLIYRTQEDMLALTERLDEPFTSDLTTDASGYTYILAITRT